MKKPGGRLCFVFWVKKETEQGENRCCGRLRWYCLHCRCMVCVLRRVHTAASKKHPSLPTDAAHNPQNINISYAGPSFAQWAAAVETPTRQQDHNLSISTSKALS